MSLETGETLGHYEILGSIGAGGMGEVYRARDAKLGREVAIKVLPEAFAQDKERLARFEREARLLASLNHTNIATIHGLEESAGLHFLVLELVEGETLAERIAKGPIAVEDALPVFTQIADALAAAHEKGVIHRDLKPANIKVTPEGKVKVLDFGLAKAMEPEEPVADSSQSPTLTKGTALGVIMGTAAYMSPEQARGRPVDKQTDIWAFGCCLFEALTGRKAFDGETVTDILGAVVKSEPDWESLPRETPTKVEAFLRRCLRKERGRRLHDVADARIEIEDALSEPDTPLLSPSQSRPRWGATRVAFLTLGVLVLGVVLGRFLTRFSPVVEQPVSRLTVTLPEDQSFAGAAPPLAISADGKRLVYTAESGGTSRLYLRELDDFEAKPLPGTEGASNPFFSLDGQWVGFIADRNLKKISVKGGTAITLCPAPTQISRDRGSGFSWGAGDTIIYSDGANRLLRVSADGGTPEQLTQEIEISVSYFWPQILPDGKSLLFSLFDYMSRESRLSLLSPGADVPRVLLRGSSVSYQARYTASGHLVYAQSGGLWAVPFDVSRLQLTGSPVFVLGGVRQVSMTSNEPVAHFALADTGTLAYVPGSTAEKSTFVWVDRDGAETLWTEETGTIPNPRLSSDGTRVAVGISSPEGSDIWVYDVARGTRTRLTFGGTNYEPIWSNDGTQIAFATAVDVRLSRLDGTGTEQLLVEKGGSFFVPSSWSPDGKILTLYEVNPNTARDIWILELDGNARPNPFLVTPFNEHSAMFSPDGRWLAYVSDESGREEVYVRPYQDSGAKHPISNDGGREPVWSHDGRELFYRNGDKMMVVTIESEPVFKAGTPRVLFQGRYAMGRGGGNNYDVTPDGRRFLMIRNRDESTPRQINVILNWTEELKRLVPVN